MVSAEERKALRKSVEDRIRWAAGQPGDGPDQDALEIRDLLEALEAAESRAEKAEAEVAEWKALRRSDDRIASKSQVEWARAYEELLTENATLREHVEVAEGNYSALRDEVKRLWEALEKIASRVAVTVYAHGVATKALSSSPVPATKEGGETQ